MNIDQLLLKTEQLTGSKKNKSCLIFSGSYLAQHIDYSSYIDREDIDIVGHNLCWLLPRSEKFTYMLHGSRGYLEAYSKECTLFNMFCEDFQGEHLFCMNSKYWNGPYTLPTQTETFKTIKKYNIKKYYIFTQEFSAKTIGYVPKDINQYKLSQIPGGCGGTLNAITIPFILKLGYKKIYVASIGDRFLHHFYDSEILFKRGVKPPKRILNNRETSLKRYKKIAQCAKNSGAEIYVMPGKLVEPEIKKIFKTVEVIPEPRT